MNSLESEICASMSSYGEEVIDLINLCFKINLNDKVSIQAYSRVSAFFALEKIIKDENPANIFYKEAMNDLLSSYLLILLGSSRVALSSLRSLLENFLFYIYYRDHPVELKLLTLSKHRLRFTALFDYLADLISIEKNKDLLDKIVILRNEYATLSTAVHGTSANFRMTAQEDFPHVFQADQKQLSLWNTRSKIVFSNIICFLINHHKDKFLNASHRHEKDILKFALGKRTASKISKTLNIRL